MVRANSLYLLACRFCDGVGLKREASLGLACMCIFHVALVYLGLGKFGKLCIRIYTNHST